MQKVFVGMSGGVDSSVSALLLKNQGYDVTGVFIKVWQPDFLPCTWREDRLDAMRVAAKLDIKFETLDLEEVYKKEVVDYLIQEYSKGNTPNPDVFCNKEVKFGAFYRWAIDSGADFVATGHYAKSKVGDVVGLYTADDLSKDQSYFLWTLSPDILSHTIFPVGNLLKSEVREIAEKNDLITAHKRDSQGLCFISQFDMKEFLLKFIPYNPGDVVDEGGEVVGRHDGASVYTIGERHGFCIFTKTGSDKPLYVVSKDIDRNILVVSQNPRESALSVNEIQLSSVNILSEPIVGANCDVVLRYHGDRISAKVSSLEHNIISLILAEGVLITEGQSAVIYDKNKVLAGGIISKMESNIKN